MSSKVGQIVSSLNSTTATPSQMESWLVTMTSLGLEGNHLCRLMTRHGAVSLLVHLLSTSHHREVRAATLRALATLCSVLEAIRQLEEVRGGEVIAKLLSDLTVTESERHREAGHREIETRRHRERDKTNLKPHTDTPSRTGCQTGEQTG